MQQGQQPGQNPQQPNTGSIQYATDLLRKLKKQMGDTFETLVDEIATLDRQFDTLGANMSAVMGQTQLAIQGLREETAIALPAIAALGGDFTDAARIQLDVAKALQTNVVLLGETSADLFTAGKVVGVASDQVGAMAAEFENAGISTGLIRSNIEQTVDIARRMGVNTTAVFDLVQQNLSRLNQFGFQNGAVGLARMAAQSASLRLNMRDIFDFAERVFDPEGAINAVAAFQRMGVAVGDLADPFRLMYLAAEDTEELQRQVVKMTEQFTYFDETTKEFKIMSNAKRDLREISKETGIAYEELIKMSIGSQKLNKIASEFRIAGLDEESKQFVANVAQFSQQRGGFVVKIGKDEKLITELATSDIEAIKELSQDPRTLEELAAEQLDATQLLTATMQQLLQSIAAPTAASRAFTDVREVLRGTLSGVRQGIDAGLGNQRGAQENINKFLTEMGGSLSELISGEGSFQKLSDVITGAITDLEEGGKNLIDAFTNVDYIDVGSKYVSSGNLVVQGAQAAYSGLTSIVDKARNFFMDEPKLTKVEKPQNFFMDDAKLSKIEKPQNFFMDETKLTKPEVTTVPTATKVEFSEIKYQGNVNVTLNTPAGSPQTFTITDQMAYDLFQNPTFQKLNQSALQNAMSQPQYSALPNLSTK